MAVVTVEVMMVAVIAIRFMDAMMVVITKYMLQNQE
jgi:hypothetical protein